MKADNNIFIIGTGAIGKALAVFLKLEKRNVILARGSIDNEPTRIEKITIICNGSEIIEAEIPVTTLTKLPEINGVVVVATKFFSNDMLAKKLKEKKGDFSILIMQNGLNIELPFERNDFKEIYRCVLFTTSQVLDNGQLSFKSVTSSPIGLIRGTSSIVGEIAMRLSTPRFVFRPEENISRVAWEKVVINCAFNSICPLLETDNGIFIRNKNANKLAELIMDECIDLAKEFKIDLDREAIYERFQLISKRSDGQLISTYEDIRNKRQTEIDSLNLEMARLAEKIGKPEIVKRTQLLGEMIAIKSEISQTYNDQIKDLSVG